MRHALLFLVLFFNLQASLTVHAMQDFLRAEEAFKLIHIQDNGQLIMQWQIADGYYLYKDKLKITRDEQTIPISNFPTGEMKYDEYFGEVEVYYQFLDLSLNLLSVFPDNLSEVNEIDIHYQGCADAGLCYPPIKKTIQITQIDDASGKNSPISPATSLSSGNFFKQDLLRLLNQGSVFSAILLFFGFGVLTAFAGCSYPMFPILSKIIIGEGETITRLRSFTLSLAYVLPIALVYALIGVVAGIFGSNLAAWFQTPVALIFIIGLLVAMALSMFGFYELQLPVSWQSRLSALSGQQKSGSYVGAAMMGFISAFIVSACAVPPIVAAVTYITQTGDMFIGAAAMFSFGLGMGFPLLLLGLSASWLLPKAGGWMTTVQKVMGVFLLSAAIWIADRLIPSTLTLVLWAILAFGCGLYLILTSQNIIAKILGALAAAFAGALLLSAMSSSNTDPNIRPLAYTYINNEAELIEAIQTSNKPVFLDYYADWCVSCKAMEKNVFTQPEVRELLEQFTLLKVDVTDETESQSELRNQQGVVGPPSFLFFQKNGTENKPLRLVGEVDAKRLTQTLRSALDSVSE